MKWNYFFLSPFVLTKSDFSIELLKHDENNKMNRSVQRYSYDKN
ncbi:hypothetical protein GCM10023142_00250 [Anaerocolumna aminovalerica]|uniref:Uncharacterized protein n=1 Tax=Anaerocolumna aminovalerica TaxID=1527 RepID=A0A1I5G363_9FIRM|nr:hypothetical protein SAMN04489757_11727 [Anaerocolumna aminovalerica]